MNLTHRNRVEYSRLNRLKIQRCGPPSPAGRANVAHQSCQLSEKGSKKEPSPLERGDRGAVGEMHHITAPSRLIIKNKKQKLRLLLSFYSSFR